MLRNIFCAVLPLAVLSAVPSHGEEPSTLWKITDRGIALKAGQDKLEKHKDHFAMSGRSVDMILEWRVEGDGSFQSEALIRWPMLRTFPNNTHGSFKERFKDEGVARPIVGGKDLSAGVVEEVAIDGVFNVKSKHTEGVETVRRIFPASSAPAVIDLIELKNVSDKRINVTIPAMSETHDSKPGVRGVYKVSRFILGEGDFTLAPGETMSYALVRTARLADEAPYVDNPESELAARRSFVKEMKESLVLKTPSPVIDRMFEFAKIRGTESIFSTRGGLMHGPGGYHAFLAAIWTNDQVEYINPFFPFLGNKLGNESAMNCYRWFAKYMNPEFKSIPSSIIAEGEGTWNGAGDRGDQAMLAYGAARFALASGNREWGRELLPLIDWSLEYCKRKMLPEGVVASDSDELEGRFPSGKANLCTNGLYYDALLTAADLWKEIDPKSEKIAIYKEEAAKLRQAMKKYFEGTVEGYDTYRYYEGNDVLRSWICMPLTVGIYDKAEGTVDALFSPKLWMGAGMLTISGDKTYWDRSALYAFRGIFAAGYQDKCLPKLLDYSKERLLGSHVPYAIEAWPEAGQSHLSAESGLYCRIFTEGLFGMRPTGFRSLTMVPRLPSDWNEASLSNVKAFGSTFNVLLKREGKDIRVLITDGQGKTLYEAVKGDGEEHSVSLN